jgi:hypothetical protein
MLYHYGRTNRRTDRSSRREGAASLPKADRKLRTVDHRRTGFVPPSKIGAELLFEMLSQRYERGPTLITSNLPFQEWADVHGSERLTGALLGRLTHHVHILEMNGGNYRLTLSCAELN